MRQDVRFHSVGFKGMFGSEKQSEAKDIEGMG